MIVKIDYKIGQIIYLKNDPEQREYLLNRIFIEQKNLLTLELLNLEGELIEVNEIHCSKERDYLKMLGKDKELETDKEDE
jgi:hypothetical protein